MNDELIQRMRSHARISYAQARAVIEVLEEMGWGPDEGPDMGPGPGSVFLDGTRFFNYVFIDCSFEPAIPMDGKGLGIWSEVFPGCVINAS